MKTPRIANAISHIDEELINNTVKTQKTTKKTVWIKWSSFAACFTILLIVAAVAVPTFFGDGNTTLPVIIGDNTTTNNSGITVPATNDNGTTTPPTVNQDTTHINNVEPTTSGDNDNTTLQAPNENSTQHVTGNEAVFSESYVYNVSDGEFSTYISGKVIAEEKTGNKIDDVLISAGWKNSFGEWLTTESLRAEVYLINGISKDVAVALKFIDKGDALTTTHYYVIMNPNADLTVVQDYIISSKFSNSPGEVIVGEVVENELAGEYVVEYTTQFVNE